MKRNQPDSEHHDEKHVKHRKVDKEDGNSNLSEDEGAAILEPYVSDLDSIQKEMQHLDEECAKEQMSIQKRYDEKKKPVLEKRQKIIDKIPGFWCRALSHHPVLMSINEEDIPVLKLLQRIELEDNLDDQGSFRIRFMFLPDVKKFFSPSTIEKEVKFSANVEPEVKVTPIEWVKGQNLVEIAQKKREESEDKELDDDADQPWSIFEWFSKVVPEYRPDVGEVIRREIWHQPIAYYMNRALADEEEEDFDDEDDDDGERELRDEGEGEDGDDADEVEEGDDGDEE